MKIITASQLAKQMNVNYPVASAILSYLIENNQATVFASVFHASGRGKPQRLVAVPDEISIKVQEVNPPETYNVVNGKIVKTKSFRCGYIKKKKKKKTAA
jgi:hypothetical protein